MSDPESNPLRNLLSGIDLGPAWARGDAPAKQPRERSGTDAPRRDNRDRGPREDRDGERRGGGGGRRFEGNRDDRRGGGGQRGNYEDRRSGPPRLEEAVPAAGVRVQLHPDTPAVHLIAKEVHHVARVYSLFDIAQILLAQRDRCRAVFEVSESKPALFLGKHDGSLWQTKEEAVRHFWQTEARGALFDEETVEVDPPAGNFQSVARCGLSGEWLGPPNFHSYQTNLRRLHRERFAHLPFEVYSSKVRTERGEEAVNAWLETMKKRVRWRLKGSDEETPWIEDSAEAERQFATKHFEEAFSEIRKAEISAGIPAKHLSPSLLASLKVAGSHARKHPAVLIPAVCRMLEAEHLPVFKREGKLFTGPARPHPLSSDAVLAERPAAIVNWLQGKKDPKLADLWKAVLPEGVEEAPQEWLSDLFWLLTQGHVLLYSNDRMVMPERRQAAPAPAAASTEEAPSAAKKKRKRKPKKRKPKKRTGVERRKLKLNPMVLRIAKSLPDHPFRHQLRNRTLRRTQVLAARDEE
ncbi:hypothetical protein KBB96_06505 [Luteolibacter ambystomatis]|uniref:Uncharacterized protein n=1 Tax=Luteolibacter ambystomatis TaxID=2824561 RepID=A0A975PGF9_9BACT|nr:hypothetical protein [Luteolibacter ambystomatis]QUE52540.1 hypothetical protein KBB96_06505 [Luteolibacter ambystomatis]